MKNIKKTLAVLALATAIGFSACKTIEEGVLKKTKECIGKSESITLIQDRRKPNKTLVVTDSTSVVVNGRFDLKPGIRCYVIYDRESNSYGSSKSVLYFTWEGTDDKYKVCGRERASY